MRLDRFQEQNRALPKLLGVTLQAGSCEQGAHLELTVPEAPERSGRGRWALPQPREAPARSGGHKPSVGPRCHLVAAPRLLRALRRRQGWAGSGAKWLLPKHREAAGQTPAPLRRTPLQACSGGSVIQKLCPSVSMTTAHCSFSLFQWILSPTLFIHFPAIPATEPLCSYKLQQ